MFYDIFLTQCAMIVGPMLVPKGEAEMAGNIMTLSLLWGLTVGVTVSLGFNEII